ncbi:uncharacterized protein LOC121716095 isoform X2 [Alosa sapidissima]|nr:uncharacterized protein LOC121716095 isoform X2 [Alosa sapidissima]
MRDVIVQLEQDYIMFKEETALSLQQLQDQIIHPDRNMVQQLCSAVRQLEEANQELRQEVRSLKEELLRMARHRENPRDHTLESRNSEPSVKNPILSESATISVNVPVAPASPHDQPPKPQQRICQSRPPSSSANISQGQQGTKSQSKEKDDIIILCDSNGNHLNPRRLFPRRQVKKFWCPTTHTAKDIIQKGLLNNPSHIIIHTGTNDLKDRRTDVAEALISTIQIATQKHPDAMVIISSILPRRDIPVSVTERINGKVVSFCADIPNVKVAHHTDITIRHLYDNVHIHKEGMQIFAKKLKDTALNRVRIPCSESSRPNIIKDSQKPVETHRPTYAAAVSKKEICPSRNPGSSSTLQCATSLPWLILLRCATSLPWLICSVRLVSPGSSCCAVRLASLDSSILQCATSLPWLLIHPAAVCD